MSKEPFHEGERRVQQRVGESWQADQNSPMIGSRVPSGAIPFLRQQSLFVLTVLDKQELWCLPLAGRPGWISATPERVHLDLQQTLVPVDERIVSAARRQQLIGGIVLDFATRRRLRINGRLTEVSPGQLEVQVAEAYPNCPKYITQRELVWQRDGAQAVLQHGEALTEEQRDAFRRTDIFFIGTEHPERGLDASHRGGDPGFVQSPSPSTICFLDYSGNSLFNTLGNLEIDPRIGILLPEFEHGRALAVTGKATVSYEDHGQRRKTTVTVERWMSLPLPVAQTESELSPYNP